MLRRITKELGARRPVDLRPLLGRRRGRGRRGGIGGKEPARLQMDERGHSDHMLPGRLRLHLPAQLEVFVVLTGHLGEPQLGDVELLDPDEVEKELERPLERVQANVVRS